jgi:hypothetical protein
VYDGGSNVFTSDSSYTRSYVDMLIESTKYIGWADRGGVKIESPSSGNIAITGNVGIGTTSPTAKLHLPASTAGAGGGVFKMTAGTLLTTSEAGVIEYDGSDWYINI